MKSSLRHLSQLGSRGLELEAEHYNRVRLALRRLENPIRLSIPGLHNTDLLLDDETWIATDQRHKDRPILALTDFSRSRAALHAPVRCRVLFYRPNAELLLGRILPAVHRLLSARLAQLHARADGACVVVALKE